MSESEDTPEFIIGWMLGSGCYKKCYELPDHPDKVLLVCPDWSGLQREEADLKRLAEAGVPVLQPIAVMKKLRYKGVASPHFTTTSGMLMQRMYCGSRGNYNDPDWANILNEKTAEDLERIKVVFAEERFYIGDLQFLYGKDGSLRVSDPLDLSFASPGEKIGYEGWWKHDTNKIEQGIAYAMYLRRENLQYTEDNVYFWDHASSHCKNVEKKRLEAAAAKEKGDVRQVA